MRSAQSGMIAAASIHFASRKQRRPRELQAVCLGAEAVRIAEGQEEWARNVGWPQTASHSPMRCSVVCTTIVSVCQRAHPSTQNGTDGSCCPEGLSHPLLSGHGQPYMLYSIGRYCDLQMPTLNLFTPVLQQRLLERQPADMGSW